MDMCIIMYIFIWTYVFYMYIILRTRSFQTACACHCCVSTRDVLLYAYTACMVSYVRINEWEKNNQGRVWWVRLNRWKQVSIWSNKNTMQVTYGNNTQLRHLYMLSSNTCVIGMHTSSLCCKVFAESKGSKYMYKYGIIIQFSAKKFSKFCVD